MFDVSDFVYRNFDYVSYTDTDYHVNCPFCDDNKSHMYIGVNKRVVHCFKCGYASSWVGLVMSMTGFPYYRAIGELYTTPRMVDYEANISALRGDDEEVEEVKNVAELPDGFVCIADATDLMANKAKKYLLHRGFDKWYWKYYNLGVAYSLPNRVIIPIEKGYWQGRRIVKHIQPKYINPKAQARDVLFNSTALDKYTEIVICEGAFSAMAVGQNAIALIGKEPTRQKTERILQAINVERFIVALEPGAYSSMKSLIDDLHYNGREVLLWKYTTGDPADPNGKFIELRYDLKTKVSLLLED